MNEDLKWNTFGGGTGAHHGNSYSARGECGEYHVDPPSTRDGGYRLAWANTMGKAAPHGGLWHELGTFRSPAAAKGAAADHAFERGCGRKRRKRSHRKMRRA